MGIKTRVAFITLQEDYAVVVPLAKYAPLLSDLLLRSGRTMQYLFILLGCKQHFLGSFLTPQQISYQELLLFCSQGFLRPAPHSMCPATPFHSQGISFSAVLHLMDTWPPLSSGGEVTEWEPGGLSSGPAPHYRKSFRPQVFCFCFYFSFSMAM